MNRRARTQLPLTKVSALLSCRALIFFAAVGFFALQPQAASAQNEAFRLYQLSVYCGDTVNPTAIFTEVSTEVGTVGRPIMGTMTICAGNCTDGTVPIADALAALPSGIARGLNAQLRRYEENASAGKRRSLKTCAGGGPPLNCDEKNPPASGTIYVNTLSGRTYAEPSRNSTLVDSPPSGSRLRYTRTVVVDGKRWYYVETSGRPSGWLPGEHASCSRPQSPGVSITLDPALSPLFTGRAAQTAGGRG